MMFCLLFLIIPNLAPRIRVRVRVRIMVSVRIRIRIWVRVRVRGLKLIGWLSILCYCVI